MNSEYLRGLKAEHEKKWKEDFVGMTIKKYTDGILATATRGGKKYDIIDIHESIVDRVIEGLKQVFDISIERHEYNNPIMIKPQVSILISW
jgi:hypothetical protein